MDTKTLRSKSRDVLIKELKDAQVHLKELQFRLSSHQLKDVREVRETRQMIARIQTILNQQTTQT